jgi:hypothetical protein
MTEALQPLVVGVALSVASGVALWWCTVRCRTAQPPSYWATEWAATSLSLLLVGLIVVSGSLVIKATVFVIPEAIVAVFSGMIGTVAIIMGTVRVMGQLPSANDEGATRVPLKATLSDAA